jgi:hypothetical protein
MPESIENSRKKCDGIKNDELEHRFSVTREILYTTKGKNRIKNEKLA